MTNFITTITYIDINIYNIYVVFNVLTGTTWISIKSLKVGKEASVNPTWSLFYPGTFRQKKKIQINVFPCIHLVTMFLLQFSSFSSKMISKDESQCVQDILLCHNTPDIFVLFFLRVRGLNSDFQALKNDEKQTAFNFLPYIILMCLSHLFKERAVLE